MFDAPRPSERGVTSWSWSAVLSTEALPGKARKSLVMLKNNDQVLPVAATASVLVAGAGADSIKMQTVWLTITWQGTGNSTAIFPGATSIFAGLREALQAGGGKAVLSRWQLYRKT